MAVKLQHRPKPPVEKMPQKDVQRFMSNIEEADGHWIWTGRTSNVGRNKDGATKKFPAFYYAGQDLSARRVAYLIRHKKIPDDMHLKPGCGEYMCVRPDHQHFGRGGYLKRMARADKSRCINGHEMTPENTYLYTAANGSVYQYCRKCRQESDRRRKDKRNATRRKAYSAAR